MKKLKLAAAALLGLAIAIPLCGQNEAKPDAKKTATTLKVKVTFSENEADKKLANLPYTFFLKPSDLQNPAWTKLRMGSRVPVYLGKDGTQYIDVGSNIDARAIPSEGNAYDVYVKLERSWVEGEVSVGPDPNSGAKDAGNFKQPIIRQFKTELNLTLHDGESVETAQAADPLTGKILTITVSLNVVR